MKTYACCFMIIMILVFSKMVLADGIYVTDDLKHVEGAHTVIVLNEEQVRSVERSREVVLTDVQLELLKIIYPGVRNKMRVLSSRWELCVCDMGFYAVWCRVGEIDVPHSSIEILKEEDDWAKENPQEAVEEQRSAMEEESQTGPFREKGNYVFAERLVVLDSVGNMFIKGKQITEAEIRNEIDQISAFDHPWKAVSKHISFDLPPPINTDIDEKILQLIRRTRSYCESKGLSFHAMGLQ